MRDMHEAEYEPALAAAREQWATLERERAARERDPGVPSTLPMPPPFPFGQPPEDFALEFAAREFPTPPGASWQAAPLSEVPMSSRGAPHAGSRPYTVPTQVAEAVAAEQVARDLRMPAPSAGLPATTRASAPAHTTAGSGSFRDDKRACTKKLVVEALERTGGNKRAAARDLGISREGVYWILRY